MNKKLEDYTAGAQSIGFDYQFYYFMYLSLEIKPGETIGFEVKDDVHIDKADDSTILLQAKHTIQKNQSGDLINLTQLDIDLWKSLSNWSDFIKAKEEFINNHSFILVTNKNENNNDFITKLKSAKKSQNINDLYSLIKTLKDRTSDQTLRKYIDNVFKLGKRKLKTFVLKLDIETEVDGIIKKIKNRILENVRDEKKVEPIYDSLYTNLQLSKYLDIKQKNKFKVSFEDFNKRYRKCFDSANQEISLPKRNFPVNLPENLEDQIFIRQLLDIGEINMTDIKDIRKYTTQMLKFINHFTYWTEEEYFVLLSDAKKFKDDSLQDWHNAFKSKYRKIRDKITKDTPIQDFEEEIKDIANDLVFFIRQKDLNLKNQFLGTEHSNGYYYALSNDLEIGWHLDWENKYKKGL